MKEFEKERKRMEAKVFQVVRLCELTSTGCSQRATSLLYSLCMIFWMVTMCCEGILFIHRTTNTTLLSNLCGIP
jgi:hypothetical protein